MTGAGSGTANSDGSGNYTFAGLANGSYTVTPSSPGYTFQPVSRAITISGANSTGVNFAATASAGGIYSISGTVSGAVTSGVTMTLTGAANSITTTGGDGSYSFTGLGNGSYTVTPSMASYTFSPTSRSVTIDNGNSTGNNFTTSDVAAVLQSTGPFGALMIGRNGEMLLPMVARDASGNATQILGALYMNSVTGESAEVYFDASGMPTKAVFGGYILLYSNWSADGKTVDIAKVYTPSGYIELFKGANVNTTSAAAIKGISAATNVASKRDSVAIRAATCFPACDTDKKNLAELLKIAGLGISVGLCGGFTVATAGTVIPVTLSCASAVVATASLVGGTETWLGDLGRVEDFLGATNVFQCALMDPFACVQAAIDMSGRTLNLLDKTLDVNSGLISNANVFLTNPNQPGGVVQQGDGLPSCPGAYECTPGGAMSYIPCYPDGVRQCGSNCTWGACLGTCGDGACDTSIAGENSTNCPSDCQTVCGDGVCAPGEETSCPQDCQANSCCVSTNNCPSETPYECGSGCCCCGYGSVCNSNHVCS